MEAQQTFIIEATQQNSVEAPTTDNFSAWTNRIEPTLLKKGDYISLNTSIVSQRGASGASNIEFTEEYNNVRDNLQSNFNLMKVGFYVCNNNVNSCPLPFKYSRRQLDNVNPETMGTSGRVRTQYNADLFLNIDGHNVVNQAYLLGQWNNPLRPLSDPTPDAFTCDALSSFQNRNPAIKIDGARFAKVGNGYNGWARNSNGDKKSEIADLLTQDIPLHISKGFKDARSVGETLTRTLQTTNEPYSNDAEYAVPRSTLFTIEPNQEAQTQNNPRFNGYCMKSIGANLQKYDDSVTNPLYNNLCVKNPFRWKYGCQLLSNSTTNPLVNNGRINENYLSVREFTKIAYPVILWSTWNTSNPIQETDTEVLSSYDFYSPHFTDAEKDEGEGGENVLEWSGFNNTMTDYNDYYEEIYDYDDGDSEFQLGQMLFKNGLDTYYIYNPPNNSYVPTDPNAPPDPVKKLAYRAFIDDDNVAFSRITGWNAKNTLGSDAWNVKAENLALEVNEEDFFTTYEFGSPTDEDYYVEPSPYTFYSWKFYGSSGGTNGLKYMYNVIIPDIEEGQTYTISFTTRNTGSVGTSIAYAHAVGVVDRFAEFGMNAMNVTADGVYTQKFTATADYFGTNGVMFYYNHGVPYNQEITLENFQFNESSLEEGDIYTITDIFEPNLTNNTSTKIYKLRVNSGQLRNEKFTLTGSTIFGGIFNRQYTAYDKFTCYKSGNDIIAFDGVNSGDHDHPVILLNRDDNNYDYIIYNQYGSQVWRIAQISKAPNDIVSGTTVGTIQGGNETSLRNPFRSGQQYYDFTTGNTWGNRNFPIYDFSSGNDFTNVTPGGYSSLRFFNTPGNAGGNIGYYDGYWTNPLNLPQRVYYRYDPQGDTTATSGTAYYPFDAVPYQRGWSFDITTGTNGTFTQTFTDGSTATYEPSGALSVSYPSYSFVSHIADPLPLIDTDKEYFASIVLPDTTRPRYNFSTGNVYTGGNPAWTYTFLNTSGTTVNGFEYDDILNINTNPGFNNIYIKVTADNGQSGVFEYNNVADPNYTWEYVQNTGAAGFGEVNLYYQNPPIPFTFIDASSAITRFYNNITYYLGATDNGDGTDTDKQGQRGRLIYSTDGGASYLTGTWDWNGSDHIDLSAGYALYYQGSAPSLTNVFQYDTAQRINIGLELYDLPSNGIQYGYSSLNLFGNGILTTDPHLPLTPNPAINEVFLGIKDMSVFDNGYQSGEVFTDVNDTGGSICNWRVRFNGDGTCDLIFTETGNDTEVLLVLSEQQTNVTKYGWVLFKSSKYNRVASSGEQTLTVQGGEDFYTGTRSYAQTGSQGRYIPDGTYNFVGDTGTTEFLENENLDKTNSNMPQSTMLMTNIEYTLENLEIVKNYFRYTEVYGGNIESSRGDISKDIENFYANFQLGRVNDNVLDVDTTEAPYKDVEPAFQYYMRDYGKMGTDDSDIVQFTDPDGNERKGSNKNQGCICPKMTSKSTHGTDLDVFTRWKGEYTSRLIATNRVSNRMENSSYFENSGWLYGKEITEANFQKNHPNEYSYVVNNNVGVYPYQLKNADGTYTLCMSFETYRDIGRDNPDLLKIQDLSWFGFSPSFLDNDYITTINTDTPYMKFPPDENPVGGLYGFTPNFIQEYNMNLINIGSAPVCSYDPDLNRFQFNYFHTPFKFNEVTGVDADLGEEVAFLNSDTLMIMRQGIAENNLESGGTAGSESVSATPPTQVHLGLADAQCGIFIIDNYGQTPSSSYITDSNNGTLITRDNYTNTLFYTLGFSYYDLKPIKFSFNSFNNRFNPNTYNEITINFRNLGTSPFTTNSAVSISDQIKTNIFTGVNLERQYLGTPPFVETPQITSNTNQGTPAFYLGYNSLLSSTIKTTSANMTSRSVIVQLQAPFYRVYCDLPLDTMSYLTDGSLSCVGYMTKNYQSQSFIYSFAADYGGYLTRDVLITNLRTEIRNPKGLLVSSLDPNSAIFYKVVRNIQIQDGLTPKQMEKQEKLLLEQEIQQQQEETEQRNISLGIIKFFKQLFKNSGGRGQDGITINQMTQQLGQPAGVTAVYQQAGVEQKEQEAIAIGELQNTLALGQENIALTSPRGTRQMVEQQEESRRMGELSGTLGRLGQVAEQTGLSMDEILTKLKEKLRGDGGGVGKEEDKPPLETRKKDAQMLDDVYEATRQRKRDDDEEGGASKE